MARPPRKAAAATAVDTQIAHGVGVVWLGDAALDDRALGQLTRSLAALAVDSKVGAIVLAARGESFCAHATLSAPAFESLLAALAGLAKPTLARLHGHAGAVGAGIAAACDIAVAAIGTTFTFGDGEAIRPYVAAAIGARAAGRYLLTGERFEASEAYRLGLVHELAPLSELDTTVNGLLGHIMDRNAGKKTPKRSK